MPVLNVQNLRSGLGRPDSKFPATPPQATPAQLLQMLDNSWGLVGTQISRAEAAWLLELGTHPNADAALLSAIARRASGVTIGSSARALGFDQWLTSIGGTPAGAGGAAAGGAGGAANTGLKGTLLPEDGTKIASTASHQIAFTSSQGLPDLQVTRRDIGDPEQMDTINTLTDAQLQGVKKGADFAALLTQQLAAQKNFLLPDKAALLQKLPEGDRSNYAYLNITGRRIEQFFNEMQRLLGRTSLTGDDAKAARVAINQQYRDAFRGRPAEFDRADTGTYWSYGHDAAFVHVFEKMLEALPDDDPKRPFIQNQIDFILSNKYTPHGSVDENDIEGSLDLVAIDKSSRHVASMTKDSDNSNSARYEVLSSSQNGAERWAYRDGTQVFWEGGRTELTAAEVGALKHTPVDTITFRRAASGEQLRQSFRYDWDKNRMLNAREIDTGWWGHCDIKAEIETLLADMHGSAGVTEFRSDNKKTIELSREMQLEALAALLNFDTVYQSTSGGGQVRMGESQFAGGRFDDRPTVLGIKTDRTSLQLPVRLDTLSQKGAPGTLLNVDQAFNPKVADAQTQTFTDNADVTVDPNNPDEATMEAMGRKMGGTTDGYTFDESGRPVESKTRFEIDPTVTTGEKVLIGTELTDINGRQLQRIYYDPKTKELSLVDTTFVEQNGKFTAQEGNSRSLGKLTGLTLQKELQAGDDVKSKLAMLEEAVRTGRKIATDSYVGSQVWNGEIHTIKRSLEYRSPDGKWERESVTIDATFGSMHVGTFIHQLDDEGKIVDSMEVNPAVDFYWSETPRIAPLISERGNWYVNKAMADRGVVDTGSGKLASLGAMQDLMDLIYLGLKAGDNKKLFTIVDQGKRYVYTDEAAWRADVDKLQGSSGNTNGGNASQIVSTRRPMVSVPDNDPTGITDKLTVDRGGAIKDVKVDIDVKHTYIGDLDISLIAPDGTKVKLQARGGGATDDIVGTYGDDLRAVDDLKALNGKDAKGDWQLKVVDLAGQDVGNLVSWGLKIDV